jgi:hypothetical protein
MKAPEVFDKSKVGTYDLLCKAGGGFVWDHVLEYRVWTRETGTLECHRFADYDTASVYSQKDPEREPPLALVLQKEYFLGDTAESAKLKSRIRTTEWQVQWLEESNHRPSMLKRELVDAAYGTTIPDTYMTEEES